jgi:homotetrameric cytidine deaminase
MAGDERVFDDGHGHDGPHRIPSGPLRNVEIKATNPDPARTLELALAAGAEDHGWLTQRDTYFRVPQGRLKIREPDGTLIPYRRGDQVSDYELVPVDERVRDALAGTLGVRVVVAKRRHLLMWEQTVRIHLDEVEGLGDYMEIEAVAAPESDLSRERDQLARLRELLEVSDGRLIDSSYSDMLLAPDPELVRLAQAAAEKAYAPYSNFNVGAAVRTTDGRRYAGANVENAAYPLGNCAEASALAAMVADGGGRLAEVWVNALPCGGCRQRLLEFGHADLPVGVGDERFTLAELLPRSFRLEADPPAESAR